MTKSELLEILKNLESSGVEFKRDDVRTDSLVKEMAGLLNREGGHIFLGVGKVKGTSLIFERASLTRARNQ